MALTVNQVRNASPGRKSDGGGLYLLTKPRADDPRKAGAKSWVLRVQYRGVRRDFGLGSVDLAARSPADSEAIPLLRRKALTLAEAREKAALGRALAKAGINPSLEWRGGDEPEAVPTFEEAARGYHAEVQRTWKNGKHGDQWLTTLQSYAFPVIGRRLVSEIDAPALRDVLLPIWTQIPETARRVRQRCLAVLDNAKGQGWRADEAPVRSLNALMKPIKQPRGTNFASMPWADVPAFLVRLRAEAPSIGRRALQFLILTAARSGEVRGTPHLPATWQEIDWEAAEWRIPGARMKAGRLHIVPLVPAAMDILREVREWTGGKLDEPIFPGLSGKPMSDATINKAMRLAGGGKFTVHGFRSSFRDWCADNGYPDAWAEASLAHSIESKQGATIAAYLRTSYYTQRRERLMPAWAAFVMGDASNVIALAERRA